MIREKAVRQYQRKKSVSLLQPSVDKRTISDFDMDNTSYKSQTESENSADHRTMVKVSTLEAPYAYTQTLATAIQDNSEELRKLICNKADDVANLLLQGLCIKESERDEIRSIESYDRKTSYLLLQISGKSFPILVKFLDIVKSAFGEVGEPLVGDIYTDYERLRQKRMVDYVCAFCNIKYNVSLLDLANYLWRKSQISNRTYRTILKPGNVSEEDLWEKLINERRTLNIITQIQIYLQEDGLFTHLAEELEQQAKIQCNKIKCACTNSTLQRRFKNESLSMVSLNSITTQESSVQAMYMDGSSCFSIDNVTSASSTNNFRWLLGRFSFLSCCTGKSSQSKNQYLANADYFEAPHRSGNFIFFIICCIVYMVLRI